MFDFTWSAAMPPEVRAIAEPLLEELQILLPTWLQRFHINWDASNTRAVVMATTNYAYRQLTITFAPAFLDQTPENRRQDLVHDLMHGTTCILADYGANEITRLLPQDEEPKYHNSVMTGFTAHHEMMTCDLTALVLRLLDHEPAAMASATAAPVPVIEIPESADKQCDLLNHLMNSRYFCAKLETNEVSRLLHLIVKGPQ